MTINGNVEFVGLKPFMKEIRRMERASKNLSPAFKRATVLYRQWIGKNFIANGGLHEDKSLKWRPLKESTKRRRRKGKGRGQAKILRDTGRLQRDWELSSGPTFGSVKSGVGYSDYHEKGTKHIPQRKIFPEVKQAQEIIAPAFNEHLFQGKKKI